MVSDPIQRKQGLQGQDHQGQKFQTQRLQTPFSHPQPIQTTEKTAPASIAERFWAPLFPENKPSKQQMKAMLNNLLRGLMEQVKRDLDKAKKALRELKKKIEGDD